MINEKNKNIIHPTYLRYSEFYISAQLLSCSWLEEEAVAASLTDMKASIPQTGMT